MTGIEYSGQRMTRSDAVECRCSWTGELSAWAGTTSAVLVDLCVAVRDVVCWVKIEPELVSLDIERLSF